jgi:hypothetical protein
MALDEELGPTPIARRLNERGIPYTGIGLWSHNRVGRILTNPKYAGSNVWNRTSQRLDARITSVDAKDWIVKADAFIPVIDRASFDRFQELRVKKRARTSDEGLLKSLKRLLASRGRLSQQVIDGSRTTPPTATYCYHFGSLRRTYELIGYDPGEKAFSGAARAGNTEILRDKLVDTLKAMFPGSITSLKRSKCSRPIMYLDAGTKISVIVSTCFINEKNEIRWKFRPGPVPERENMTLLCRVNPDDKGFHSFYIFRRVESSKTRQLKEHDRWLETGERLSQLSDFYLAAKRLALTPDSAQ